MPILYLIINRFKKDKFDNQNIIGMISADDEEVDFTQMIFPAEAKGMVRRMKYCYV